MEYQKNYKGKYSIILFLNFLISFRLVSRTSDDIERNNYMEGPSINAIDGRGY